MPTNKVEVLMGSYESPRPVKCCICHCPMYYIGDIRYEAEIKMELTSHEIPSVDHEIFYAHARCLMPLIGG